MPVINPPAQSPAYDSAGNVIGVVSNGQTISQAVQSALCSLGLAPAQNSAYPQAGDATNGVVLNVQLPALGAFYGCRLIYKNYSTTVPLVFDGVKVAPAAVSISPGNNALAFVSSFLTVNGAQSFTVPLATTGAGGQLVPGVVITDFIAVRSIARTDVPGAPPLLRVASHIQPGASATTHPGLTQTPLVALNSLGANPGLVTAAASFSGTGNTLANLTSTVGNTATYGAPINPITAVFYYTGLKKDIWIFGDSLYQGYGTASQVAGISQYLSFASYANANPIGGSNFAQQGQKLVDSLARLKAVVGAAAAAGYKPKYVLWKAWSPNDPGGTQASFDTDFAYTLEAINYLATNGIIPVVSTSPMATGTSTLALLQASNALVMGLPPSVLKVDAFGALTPGGVWNPAYNSGDSVHPNDAGMAAWAGLVANVLAAI